MSLFVRGSRSDPAVASASVTDVSPIAVRAVASEAPRRSRRALVRPGARTAGRTRRMTPTVHRSGGVRLCRAAWPVGCKKTVPLRERKTNDYSLL